MQQLVARRSRYLSWPCSISTGG